MAFNLDILLEFVSSLALVALLAMGYGFFRRHVHGNWATPVVLGLIFGLVTILQMHTPLQPVDGVIIDMRNVPIALAGAFLGWRGLAVCLCLAVATRYGIGGVGWVSGVAGMALAGGAGLLWDRMTRHHQTRGIGLLVILAVAMSSHLAAVFLLPADVARWFLTVAALPILGLNLVSLPLVGILLERERQNMQRERRWQAAAYTDPETGLLTESAFGRDIALAAGAGSEDPIESVLVLRLRDRCWLCSHMGPASLALTLGTLRHRIRDLNLVANPDLLGQSSDGRLLIPLTRAERETCDDIQTALRRSLSDHPIQIPGADPLRVSIDCTPVTLPDRPESEAIQACLRTTEKLRICAPAQGTSTQRRVDSVPAALNDQLFLKTETLLSGARG